ncbi:unnamed protein product [Linum tenue]|uniref:Uncharacterized protein n=1 Tax=Linum tenue TaxID=586396 RepID=A0AAV0INN0_9ROSI|nr:unnamed protein product [Linum tenue]
MADLASFATISSCCSASSAIASRGHSSPSSFIPLGRSPRYLSVSPHFKAYLAVNAIRPRKFSIVAVARSATTVPSDEKSPSSNSSQPASVVEPEQASQEQEVIDVLEYDEGRIRVCDKLIEVFMVDKTTPTDWRRLLAFSREWDGLRPHFYRRCQERADNETDPGMKHSLLRLSRKLKEVDEDVQRHNELLEAIRKAPAELGEIVSRRRKDFTQEFFVHLYTVAQSYKDDKAEQNALAKLGNDCVAVVQAYDNATEDTKAVNAAELKLQDIINSPSLDAACRKIDDLAQKNQLDSALVLMLTKAWSDAKETNMTKDEVKDILYHLYKTAVGNLQRLMPKEIRIVKHLLTIEDPEERLSNLNDAFTPGEELEGGNVDCLYTTPEKLHTWMKAVVDAYHHSREGTLIREARDLMNPKIIKKLEELIKLVEDHFM